MHSKPLGSFCSIYRTTLGFGILRASAAGFVAHELPFAAASFEEAQHQAGAHLPESPLTARGAELLSRYFAGERIDFSQLPLDLAGCTPFQQEVYRRVALIPYGCVVSYGEVASRCGSPKGARAIGTAMAKNSLPILIPCHRVLGSRGKLTGFSAPGGLASKRDLLVLEGVFLI